MENLIVILDFKQPFAPYGGADSADYVNAIITQYQKDILTQILGEIEYNAFETDLNGTDTPTLDQWDWFLNGTTYTYNSVSYVYPGIKQVLTKFMYYYWQRNTASDLGNTGQVQKVLLNSAQVIPSKMMVQAYNLSVDEIYNKRTYGPTVYNFLSHQQSLNSYFPDWDFTSFDKINIYNI
jgi:hypothetical protein